ncbi:hypothetical protein [Paraburkholderia silvatlantica]|uniref:hypothetical protein n=1 Tax=Paraburkholderia silvatlantica TaxID=321895 RepID=UPI001FD353B4|nr:hypothetical protein [Paraburkholderia silvatlantica]
MKASLGQPQFCALSAILQSIEPAFDGHAFLVAALDDLESLTLMERVRRASAAMPLARVHCEATTLCWHC